MLFRRKKIFIIIAFSITVLILIFGSFIFMSSVYVDGYSRYTPEFLLKDCGLSFHDYEILSKDDDKNLGEDGWGQLIWILKLKKPVEKDILNKLVEKDIRWEFQDDVRQQYHFLSHEDSFFIREIILSVEDPIVSVSCEWKK